MNLTEAVKTTRRFRRAEWNSFSDAGWYSSLRNAGLSGRIEAAQDNGHYWPLTTRDILAEDWEVEEEKIEITRTQLSSAFKSAVHWADDVDDMERYVTALLFDRTDNGTDEK